MKYKVFRKDINKVWMEYDNIEQAIGMQYYLIRVCKVEAIILTE